MSCRVSYLLSVVLIANLVVISAQFVLCWSSPMLPKLYSENLQVNPFGRVITKTEDSWIVSLPAIGAIIGPLICGITAKSFGRKICLILFSVPIIISYLILALSKNLFWYYFSRFLLGVCHGAISLILPIYLLELGDTTNRGIASISNTISYSLGDCLVYFIGPYTSATIFNFILVVFPFLFLPLFSLIAPETPYYLVLKKRLKQAKTVLVKLRGTSDNEIDRELAEIELVATQKTGKFLDLFIDKQNWKGMKICLVLLIGQELTGAIVIDAYTEELFTKTNTQYPEVFVMGVAIFGVFSGVVITMFSEYFNRRTLLCYFYVGTTISNFLLGLHYYLSSFSLVNASYISFLPVVSLVFFIGTFSSINWTISSELFNTEIVSIATSIAAFIASCFEVLIARFFNNLNDFWGSYSTFWFFAVCCFGGCLFSVFFVPETRGKSFQEIQDSL